MKKGQPKFTVHVKADVFFEACIPADSLKDALEKAEAMSWDEIWDTTGSILDTQKKITAVFE